MVADVRWMASGYDVFLSHSHVDKEVARALFDLLALTDYNGRVVRPWLDQEILDPGALASPRELESALDRSRFLVLVFSPEALGSTWVQNEIDYFLTTRTVQEIIVLIHRPCPLPEELSGAPRLAWSDSASAEQLAALVTLVCPQIRDHTVYDPVAKKERRAWQNAHASHLNQVEVIGTDADSQLLHLLMTFDIGDLDEEGDAVAAWGRVGARVAELSVDEGYASKMVLGEFLALAMLRDTRYGRVMSDFVEADASKSTGRVTFNTWRNRALRAQLGPPATTNLLFAVARADSKLADIASSRIDLSTAAALLHHLDLRGLAGVGELTVAGMIGRVLGKLRDTPTGQVLIHTLSACGGDASCYAAAGAIGGHYGNSTVVYLTKELEDLSAAARSAPSEPPPPSASLARLLLEKSTSRLWRRPAIEQYIQRDLDDLIRFYGSGSSFPDDSFLASLHAAPPPTKLRNGPLVGTIRRVTRANMESYADTLGPTEIACLTEPRIVDALLAGAGGYLISDEETTKPLGIRLEGRRARFATYSQSALAHCDDGAVLALWPGPTDADSAQGFITGVDVTR